VHRKSHEIYKSHGVQSLDTIKRTIVVRKYSNKQIKFLALWPENVHGIVESGFQSSLHMIRTCIHRRKNRLQGKFLPSLYTLILINKKMKWNMQFLYFRDTCHS
jgi:hypothetical protein